MKNEVYVSDESPVPFDEKGGPVWVDPTAKQAWEADVLDHGLQFGTETGGLLVGPAQVRVIYEYLPSGRGAQRGAASYTTDPEHLQPQLEAAWQRHGGDVIGYLHSHPPGFGVPSQQDLYEAARMLADPDYRSMTDEVLLPIATIRPDPAGGVDNQVFTRWFVLRRGGVLLEVAEQPLPRREAIDDLERELVRDGFQVERYVLPQDGLALRVAADGGRYVLLLPPTYPADEPRLFAERPEGGLEALEATAWWDTLREPDARSTAPAPAPEAGGAEVTRRAPAERNPTTPTSGPRVLLSDRHATQIEGVVALNAQRTGRTWVVGSGDESLWVRRDADGLHALLPDGQSVVIEVVPLTTELQARSAGLVLPDHLAARRVLVVGAGSVGSALTEQLARAGVGGFTLVDPDTVSASNLCRSTYVLADVGRPKVVALAERLRAINPHVEVETHALDVQALFPHHPAAARQPTVHPGPGARPLELPGGLSTVDLVVVAVDQPDVIRMLDREIHPVVPAIYPGVYARGSGGEVLFTWPGSMPLSAVLEEVRFGAEPPPIAKTWDYSTDRRLAAEPALVAQIAHIVAAAAMIGLALLSEGTDTEMARVLDRQYQGVFLANQRGWIFQYPLQAVWATFGT